MKKAVYFLLIYHSVMRGVTNYYNNDSLYYVMDAVLIGCVGGYMYYYSEKNIVSNLSLILILLLAINQITNVFYMLYQNVSYNNYLPYFMVAVIFLDIYVYLNKKIKKLLEL